MSETKTYIWDPPDAASKLLLDGVWYTKGQSFSATEEQVQRITAAWYVPVKRVDLPEQRDPSIASSEVRSSTVHVPVPVVIDAETGEPVGGPLDIDGALDAAGEVEPANPNEVANPPRRPRRRR